jgi:hypothetical protein
MTHAITADEAITAGIKFTLENGGSTQSITGMPIPTDGYLVSLGMGNGMSFDADLLTTDQGWRMAFDFVATHFRHLSKPGWFLGFWIDTETNLVWLDVTEWMPNRDAAFRAASDRDEIAIWDIDKAEEIRVS